ncbi:MAG TPA: hypothetical protein VF113_13535 [Stellaceae bacterium]
MATQHIAITSTGLVTSVGLSAVATCAALRAGVSNAGQTRFVDAAGEWIVGHGVALDGLWLGLKKLTKMAAMAIEECLVKLPREQWTRLPLFLCVAERQRPGRLKGLDEQLFLDIQDALGVQFSADSAIIAAGRVSVGRALAEARRLIYGANVPRVVIAAVDSLLNAPVLGAYEREERLMTSYHRRGFAPGEAAGALLVAAPSGAPELLCTGIGFGMEQAPINSDKPLRADGLTQAIAAALAEADCQMHDLDFRITDLSGEQYYFKEAALALARILRRRKEEFDIWHPADCVGEVGAAAGTVMLALGDTACRKSYARGPNILAHLANDAGQRAATVLRFRGA